MVPAAALPAAKTHRHGLADVLPSCLAALRGERGPLALPRARHVVVVLVDGLGQLAVEAHRAYARRLLAAPRRDVIQSVFPSTTASALATLTTGELPGRHGVIGYQGFDPGRDTVVHHLTGWGADLDPATWQRMPTIFERARAEGVPTFAIGPARYADSGFTAAVLRGADYRAGEGIAGRLAEVRRIRAEHDVSLSYVYAPEVDVAAHARGVGSEAWLVALEELDAAVGAFVDRLGPDAGVLVTGDHGGLDVPPESHVVVDAALLEGVRHVAGEPRCLALHLEPGADPDAVLARWRAAESSRSWIASRQEAVAAGLFGEVDPEVLPRIGDILVAARKRVAYYVDPLDRGRAMVGQHGSLTPDETHVPLLRFGAFG